MAHPLPAHGTMALPADGSAVYSDWFPMTPFARVAVGIGGPGTGPPAASPQASLDGVNLLGGASPSPNISATPAGPVVFTLPWPFARIIASGATASGVVVSWQVLDS